MVNGEWADLTVGLYADAVLTICDSSFTIHDSRFTTHNCYDPLGSWKK